MSNSIPAPNYTQIPNIIIDYWMSKLNETQFKCLVTICRKTFGWHKQQDKISISQFVELTGITERNVQKALDYLINIGLVIKELVFTKSGDQAPSLFYVNIKVKEKNTDVASDTTPPSPATPTKTRPMSSLNSSKGKDYEKSMPFADAKEVNDKIPSKTKYHLKQSQLPLLELLKTLDLECDDSLLYILIRTHSESALTAAISHLLNEIAKGTRFRKGRIAFFRDTLKGNQSPVTDQCKKNRDYAMRFANKYAWNSLIIKDKYCECSISGKEIPNNFSEDDFKERLHDAYEIFKGMS